MEFLTSFLVAVLGGVACHYIIKWLDGNDKGEGVKNFVSMSKNLS